MTTSSLISLMLAALTVLSGCSSGPAVTSRHAAGPSTHIGRGQVHTFATLETDGSPRAIGVAFTASALQYPPTSMSDGTHCHDYDNDGRIEEHSECMPTHARVIPLPDIVATRADVPFKWVLFHWNPGGHEPPGIYDVPHFDVHYMMEPIESIFALQPGTCGIGKMRCDQYERARKPLPANYMHPDYKDVDAVIPAMGNHLIDVTGPEFNGSPFRRTFIFGAYDGRVTFYEEMVTRDFLLAQPNECYPIKSPEAVAISGYYPTKSCFRHNARSNETTVSVEGFQYRTASGPAPVARAS